MSAVYESPDGGGPLLSPRTGTAESAAAARRILIVDDDPAIRRLFETLARREGIDCDTASNGVDAVAALRQGSYSLLFLDLMMPCVDGWGVLDYVRTRARERHPSIFVITAFLDQAVSTADREVVGGILYKPVDADDIAALLRAWTRGGSAAAVLLRTRHRLIAPA